MDTGAKHGSDDLELDALMVRVREAALAVGPSGDAARPGTGDANDADIDLVRVIDAQAEWNEHTRQSLAALVDCLRTLRDDWTDAHARLREDVGRLSALVNERRNGASSRPAKKRRSVKGGRRRS
jgi:hypothetical protein